MNRLTYGMHHIGITAADFEQALLSSRPCLARWTSSGPVVSRGSAGSIFVLPGHELHHALPAPAMEGSRRSRPTARPADRRDRP